MGARYIDGCAFNIYSVWIIGYLTSTIHISRSHAFNAVMIGALLMGIFVPVFGYLSDRLGRPKIYFWSSLCTGFIAFPALWLVATSAGNTSIIWLSTIIPLGILHRFTVRRLLYSVSSSQCALDIQGFLLYISFQVYLPVA